MQFLTRRRDFDYGIIPLPTTGASGAISDAATAGTATAFFSFFAFARLAFRGLFAAFLAFAFLAGARLAFLFVRIAAFLALIFFLDFFALRAMSRFLLYDHSRPLLAPTIPPGPSCFRITGFLCDVAELPSAFG